MKKLSYVVPQEWSQDPFLRDQDQILQQIFQDIALSTPQNANIYGKVVNYSTKPTSWY